MGFILRSVFWLGLALLVIQPPGADLSGSARQLGSAAMETGRSAALDGIGRITCDSFECAGAKLVAEATLQPQPEIAVPAGVTVADAPFPTAPLNREDK